MARKRAYDNLVQTTILVEADLLEAAKAAGLNISETCRAALVSVINDPILRKKYDKFERVPEEIKAEAIKAMTENIIYAKGQAAVFHNTTGLKFTPDELIEWFDKQKYKSMETQDDKTPKETA